MKKDNVFAILAVLAIILLSIFIVFIDKIFPTPDMPQFNMPVSGYSTLSNSSRGTNPGASVTIESFSDFQCPFCAVAAETMNQILANYGTDVNFVFKHFPVHEGSQEAAEAAECAADQGKFLQYHYLLFRNQYSLDTSSLKKYAAQLGLDSAEFNDCMDSGKKLAIVRADFSEAQARNVQGTPTFFINGNPIVGAQPYSVFEAAIEEELSK